METLTTTTTTTTLNGPHLLSVGAHDDIENTSSSLATAQQLHKPSGVLGDATEYSTVNYNGLIGINASDPFSINAAETRAFALPIKVQVSCVPTGRDGDACLGDAKCLLAIDLHRDLTS